MNDPNVEYRPFPRNPEYMVGSDGSVWSRYNGRIRKPTAEWHRVRVTHYMNGVYPLVHIRKIKMISVGAAVLEAFVGPRPFPGAHVCHFPDRDANNNTLANLRWGTPQENATDRVIHGTSPRGEQHSKSKLTEDIVREILQTYDDVKAGRVRRMGWSIALARKYGVTGGLIQLVKNRAIWRHVQYP